MIRMIILQIWNQRRQNLWIWLELGVLSAFLWIAIDPLFTMVCLKTVPSGLERDKVYYIRPTYDIVDNEWVTLEKHPAFVPAMDYLLTQLQAHPMVEATCLGRSDFAPGSRNLPTGKYYRNLEHAKLDEGKERDKWDHYTLAQDFIIPYVNGLEKWTDILYTLGMRDAISGEYLHVRPDTPAQKYYYVSASMATRLYGTPNAKDSVIYNGETYIPVGDSAVKDQTLYKIDAVYANVKACDFETPYPSTFMARNCNGDYMFYFGAFVRLKKGTDGEKFIEDVYQDVLKNCCISPFSDFDVIPLKESINSFAEESGANNVVRIQAALGFFGLLCVFLGVSGLFWVRCGERRQDIGVMRSMGATHRMVNRQMLLEGSILLSAAFLAAMLFVAWYVHVNGYDMGLTTKTNVNWQEPDMSYWFNRPKLHLLAVTLITYALMLLICLLATWMPVHRATRILPSDALRDE